MYVQDNTGDGDKKIRFLIITGLCGIGDGLFVSPVVQTLHRAFPDSYVVVLARDFPWTLELFENIPYVDKVFVYDYERKNSTYKGMGGLIRLRRSLSGLKPDIAICLHDTFRAAAVAYLSGAYVRIGYNTEHRGFLLTHYKKKRGRGYSVRQYLSLLELLGIKRDEFLYDLVWKVPQDVCESVCFLDEPYVVLVPGSSWKLKSWPVENYAFIVQKLVKDGITPVVIGKGEDESLIGRRLSAYGAVNLVDRFSSLSAVGCILSKASVVVGGDTGIVHLASALTVDTIMLWGPTSPVEMVCRMNNRKDFYLSYPCYRICRKTLANHCPYDQLCLKSIRPDWVYEEIHKILGNRPG